jgi:hypothetical protein
MSGKKRKCKKKALMPCSKREGKKKPSCDEGLVRKSCMDKISVDLTISLEAPISEIVNLRFFKPPYALFKLLCK